MKRQKTMEDPRSPIEKYLDNWWRNEITRKEIEKSAEIEEVVRRLISRLLYVGEELEDPELLGDPHKHKNENLLQHQEQIIAILEAIRPGICALMCSSFTKEMLKSYFVELSMREYDEEDDDAAYQRALEDQIAANAVEDMAGNSLMASTAKNLKIESISPEKLA